MATSGKATGEAMSAPDVPDDEPFIITAEQVDEWLAHDRQRFEEGDLSAWIRALGCAKLAGREAPRWAWEFVVEQVHGWGLAENDIRLEELLGLSRPGHASSRRISLHKGTIYFVAGMLDKARPGWKKSAGAEVFWAEVARAAASDYGMPPVGWEKARKMYADYERAVGARGTK